MSLIGNNSRNKFNRESTKSTLLCVYLYMGKLKELMKTNANLFGTSIDDLLYYYFIQVLKFPHLCSYSRYNKK